MFPHTDRPLSGAFVFVWMLVDLPLAPARGSPFLFANLLKPNRLLFEVAYHTDIQIGDYKAAACLQSVRYHKDGD